MSKNKKTVRSGSKTVEVKKKLKKVNRPAEKKATGKKSNTLVTKKPLTSKKEKASAVKKVLTGSTKPVKKVVAVVKKSEKKLAEVNKPVNKPSLVVKKLRGVETKSTSKKVLGNKEKENKAAGKAKLPVVKNDTPKNKKIVEKKGGKSLTQEKPTKTNGTTKKPTTDKKQQGVLAITNTIPVLEKPDISASRIATISRSITNPIKRTDSYSVKVEKEPSGKFEIEFVVHASAEMLYEFLSTPSGLSEWFCDDLNIRNGIYTFIWEDAMQQARLLKTIDVHLVRFQWVDKTDGSYFEFKIQHDDLTNDISLIITDFAESLSEKESAKLLWHSQIEKLMHVIGSIF